MIGFFKSDSSLTDSFWKLIKILLSFQIPFHISLFILGVWFKSELYTALEYVSDLIHISFPSNYTSDLSIVLMSAVEIFEIWFKSENSYLSSSIWKNEMAAGPALYMSAWKWLFLRQVYSTLEEEIVFINLSSFLIKF